MAESAHAPAGWLVGAYAAAPARDGWDEGREAAFVDNLLALDDVLGLELPWTADGFHVHDDAWMLDRLPDDARIVVTTAPDASARHRASREFGLASTDAEGRRAAIDAVRSLHAALPRLRAAIPSGELLGIELHAAPRAVPGASSPDALRASLEELAGWEWHGATLAIEHCDAWLPTQRPAKGYLHLEDELGVVRTLRDAGAAVGMTVNWGRSVIERRDADAGRRHVAAVAAAGVLEGVVLSGAAPVATPLGSGWADVHAPFADGGAYAGSLLTPERAAATLAATGGVGFRAVKVAAPSGATVDERVAVVARALDAVRAVDALAG